MKLADWVHAGICSTLLPAGCKFETTRHMVDLRILSIRRAASLVKKPEPGRSITPKPVEVENSPSAARLLISLAQSQSSTELLDRAELRLEDPWAKLILVHEAVARLAIPARQGAGKPEDPLQPIRARVINLQKRHHPDLMNDVLALWAPDIDSSSNSAFATKALLALKNVSGWSLSDLLVKRKNLLNAALGEKGDPIDILPSPPGIGVPGVIGWQQGFKSAHRFDIDSQVAVQPANLSWEHVPDQERNEIWLHYTSRSLAASPIQPARFERTASNKLKALKWVAAAFRSLASQKASDPLKTCIPTARNLLGPDVNDVLAATSRWQVLAYEVSRSRVTGQAFIRQGDIGLVPEPITETHDDLWRIGAALADRLGYLETSRSLRSLALSAQALKTGEDDNWAAEGMLRFGLHRLRGQCLPPKKLPLDSETGLPLTVERVLTRLESFPGGSSPKDRDTQIAFLVATLAEGRALFWRKELSVNPNVPGGGTSLLAELTRLHFQIDEELAEQLPRVPKPDWAPKRRAALAWAMVSERVQELVRLTGFGQDLSLCALACGARLLGVQSNIKAQALEQWCHLDSSARSKLVGNLPAFSEWDLDATAILHTNQGITGQTLGTNIQFLFEHLQKATSSETLVSLETLQGVTPLGWLVILGTLTGAGTGGLRGAGTSQETASLEGAFSQMRTLAKSLSRTAKPDPDAPWADLSPILSEWTDKRVSEVFEALNNVDSVTGTVVRQPDPSPHFVLSGGRGRVVEITSPTGTIQLLGWQIGVTSLIGESAKDGIERVRLPNEDNRISYRWSESWGRGRVISVSVVQPAMASLAGFHEPLLPQKSELRAESAIADRNPNTRPEIPSKAGLRKNSEPSLPQKDALKTQLAAPGGIQMPSASAEEFRPHTSERAADKINADNGDQVEESTFRDLRRKQMEAWRKRSRPAASDNNSRHARIALLQWEVDQTFAHPLSEVCSRANESIALARGKHEVWTSERAGLYTSCAEHRRREILRRVLEACKVFGVDILLLPEYSVRPETVDWLKVSLPSLAPETTVWAGTYLQRPYSVGKNIDPNRSWSAVIPVVLPSGDILSSRTKKYPSLLDPPEVFNPSGVSIAPIYSHNQPTFDVRAFTFELVCSEIFLATSPSNFFRLAWAHRELAKRFGKCDDPKKVEEMVAEDIKNFAKFTCTTNYCGQNRRSIILVPSMTGRTADFAVLGQANFLAASLTTVFCNAVVKKYGRGQSCFIGCHGWDKERSPNDGGPNSGPYHGVEPGIYKPYDPNRGHLGTREQALVIADVDPLYSAEGRPRPQMLAVPLRLVAHLPLVESWNCNGSDEESAHPCRCKRSEMIRVPKFARPMYDALYGSRVRSFQSSGDDMQPEVLHAALLGLAESAGNNDWLRQRAGAYQRSHASDPHGWPPPVGVDWLWIDLGNPATEQYPEIEVPPFTRANSQAASHSGKSAPVEGAEAGSTSSSEQAAV